MGFRCTSFRLALLYFSAADCAVTNRAREHTDEAGALNTGGDRVELSESVPAAELPLSRAESPAHLQVQLTSVRNPRAAPFQLVSKLAWRGEAGPEEADLAPVSPYPPTDPQSLLLEVPASTARALTRQDGVRVRLALAPVPSDGQLPKGLRVAATAHWAEH